jgi:hypothetical protein
MKEMMMVNKIPVNSFFELNRVGAAPNLVIQGTLRIEKFKTD